MPTEPSPEHEGDEPGDSTSAVFRNLVLEFDLPFVLRVPDSIKKETTPEDYEQYILPVGGVPAMLRFERKMRDLGGVSFAIEDHRGLLNYSQAQVWFDSKILARVQCESSFREKTEGFVAEAVRYVNRFVDAYRAVMETYWVPRLVRSDIARIQFTAMLEGEEKDHFDYMGAGTGVALGSIVRGEKDKTLRSLVTSEWEVDPLARFADLVPILMKRGEYWSATMAALIYFEAWVARLLRAHFREIGLSEEESDQEFENSRGFPRSITSLIKSHVVPMCDFDLDDEEAGTAYRAWCESARDLRNDIAHGKLIDVTGEHATAAVDAVRNFIDLIRACSGGNSPAG